MMAPARLRIGAGQGNERNSARCGPVANHGRHDAEGTAKGDAFFAHARLEGCCRDAMPKLITSEQLDCLATGAWILGTGGGGDPYRNGTLSKNGSFDRRLVRVSGPRPGQGGLAATTKPLRSAASLRLRQSDSQSGAL
jgi:hypothetical protein